MPSAALALYALDPAMQVLLRPDGAVQVGWDPRRAVLIRPPARPARRGVGHPAAVTALTDTAVRDPGR